MMLLNGVKESQDTTGETIPVPNEAVTKLDSTSKEQNSSKVIQ